VEFFDAAWLSRNATYRMMAGMARQLDRSKLPRRPRERAAKRAVAEAGRPPEMTEFEDEPLSAEALDIILADLSLVVSRDLAETSLVEWAQEYLRTLDQPQTSKEQISYDLQLMAHLLWREANGSPPYIPPRAKDPPVSPLCGEGEEPAPCVATPPPEPLTPRMLLGLFDHRFFCWEARDLLAVRLACPAMELLARIDAGAIGWGAVGDAAAAAWIGLKGGDYTDPNLALAVQLGADLYELMTGEKLTWSGKSAGPISKDGTTRRSGASAGAQFLHRLFQTVGPHVSRTAIDGALRELIKRRNRQQT
jgi:hypothetical protein